MTFLRAEPSARYGLLRLLSREGRWEIGFHHYHSGVRLRMGPAGLPPSVIDFCLGHNPGIFSPVLLAVLKRLEGLDEAVGPEAIDSVFPWAGTRPDVNTHLGMLLDEPLTARSNNP